MRQITIILATISLASPIWSARLFSSGFELQSIATGVEWDTITGSPSIDTTVKQGGAASMHCAPTAATAYVVKQTATMMGGNVWFWRFYIYMHASPSVTTYIWKLQPATGNSMSLRLTPSRKIQLWDDSTPAQSGSDSVAISTDTWTRVEVKADWSNNVSSFSINGISQASGTPPIVDATSFRLGCGCDGTNVTTDLYFDDVAFNDSAAGGNQTGFPGVGSIVHMHPDGAGDSTVSISLGGNSPAATAWESVDETTPNDYTDISSMTATSSIMDFTLQSAASVGIGTEDTVTLVQIGSRVHMASAASATWRPGLKTQALGIVSSGTLTTTAVVAWNTNDDTRTASPYYKGTFYTDPQAGGALTSALLDTAQLRIFTSDVTPVPGISTTWALIDFVDNAAAGGAQIPNPMRVLVAE